MPLWSNAPVGTSSACQRLLKLPRMLPQNDITCFQGSYNLSQALVLLAAINTSEHSIISGAHLDVAIAPQIKKVIRDHEQLTPRQFSR